MCFDSRKELANGNSDCGIAACENCDRVAKDCGAFTDCVCEPISIMDGVKTGGFFAVGPFGDPGGGINECGIGEEAGFFKVHSSMPLAPSLVAKKSAVSDDAMNVQDEAYIILAWPK